MGIFSRIKTGISSKANAALDKAIDPEKELEMMILELEDGRKKALAELVTYKATAKQLEHDIEKHRAKAAEWEKRAMLAVNGGGGGGGGRDGGGRDGDDATFGPSPGGAGGGGGGIGRIRINTFSGSVAIDPTFSIEPPLSATPTTSTQGQITIR